MDLITLVEDYYYKTTKDSIRIPPLPFFSNKTFNRFEKNGVYCRSNLQLAYIDKHLKKRGYLMANRESSTI